MNIQKEMNTMIKRAEIIKEPFVDDNTRIYDHESEWNTTQWTYISFENEDSTKWCGLFRGKDIGVETSEKNGIIVVLTSDYIFQLDIKTGNMTDVELNPFYKNLTISPDGDFVIADDYNIDIIRDSIRTRKEVKPPIKIEQIKFKQWNGNKLEFSCIEFMDDRFNEFFMEYDSIDNKIYKK